MSDSIFRKKNLDKISSPEKLDDYLKVTSPSVWMALTGVVLVLVGLIVWSIVGTLDTNINTAVNSDGKTITCYLSETDVARISEGMKVHVNDAECFIKSISNIPEKSSDLNEYAIYKAGLSDESWIYVITLDGSLDEGIYAGYITVNQINPISYVFNNN